MRALKEQNTFSVSFFPLKTRPLANGDLPICVQLYYAGKRTQFSFRQAIPPNDWDYKRGKVKTCTPNAYELNQAMSEISERFYKLYHKLVELGITFTVQNLKMRFFDDNNELEKNNDMGLLKYFDMHLIKISFLLRSLSMLTSDAARFYRVATEIILITTRKIRAIAG